MDHIANISRLIRYWIVEMTTRAGSGHPTSSLSSVELMTVLFFGSFFRYDTNDIENPNNDRIIFSKGHASPLFYALWAASGAISVDELASYRKFASRLEGHPSRRFPFTEVPTGSLGQGLGAGVGMALAAKYLDKTESRTFVLLGDSEIAEGSVWEAVQIASFYGLQNLVAIIDASRLGQSGETMIGWNVQAHKERFESFGWRAILVEDGHDTDMIRKAYQTALLEESTKPTVLIAKTIKGKGVSFLENTQGWHGKTLSEEMFFRAKEELGFVDMSLRSSITKPKQVSQVESPPVRFVEIPSYQRGDLTAIRKAYGISVAVLVKEYPNIVMLDAEVGNSTYAEDFRVIYPERYFEMFIAEQNMVSAAVGLARRGKNVFLSTFGAFFTRAYDQLRMAQYSGVPLVLVGSHVGVSIGEDGASQMALEDIAMMRPLLGSTVLYPSDAVSMRALLREAVKLESLSYIRATRAELPVLYEEQEVFPIGGSKMIRISSQDRVTVVAAGITLHESIRASEILAREGILIRVIDLYSIKPIDKETILLAARETEGILIVEDHYPEGGIADAVREALSTAKVDIYSLAVRKMPCSGKPEELIWYEEIGSDAIVAKVKNIIGKTAR